MLDPRRAAPYTDIEEPTRMKLLSENPLPKKEASRIENAEPNLVTPYKDADDPKRNIDRIEYVDPI
jgi:hypothetical protein